MISLTERAAAGISTASVFPAPVAEQFHTLVHRLRAAQDTTAAAPKTVGVTGFAAGAGVSSVALELALAAARTGDGHVLLLDLSGARPTLASRFGVGGNLGLADALAAEFNQTDCVRTTSVANVSLLALSDADNSHVLLQSCGRLEGLLHALEQDFSLIVVDLPTTESALCLAVAGLLGGVVLVMESEHTRLDAAQRGKHRLLHAHANVLGAVLNKHRRSLPNWLDKRL